MMHSRAFISRASGCCRLGLPRSSKFVDARNTCSLGRVRHVIGTLPGRCGIPFSVRMSKFGCHRVTSGLNLPLKAIGDHVFFAQRHLRRRLGSFMWVKVVRSGGLVSGTEDGRMSFNYSFVFSSSLSLSLQLFPPIRA